MPSVNFCKSPIHFCFHYNNKKFYDTKDEAIAKLDVYFAMNRIGEEEYAELALLAESVYEPEKIEDDLTA